jgi:hypothetical protein
MKTAINKTLAASAAIIVTASAYAPIVSAQSSQASASYQVNLTQQNKSGASGTATLTVTGTNVAVTMRGNGFSPNLAHATHVHIGGQDACPTPAADKNKDSYVDAKEADAFVGDLRVSLTTSGDTSANSALSLDRAPKADAKGAISYNRTFTLPSNVKASDLEKASLDVHGISTIFDDKAKYDGNKKSELDNKVAFEATAPAACGQLTSSPTGGAATGVGSVSGVESPALLMTGVAAIAASLGALFVARRQLVRQDIDQ